MQLVSRGMALPHEVLDEIASLGGPLTAIQETVERVAAAQRADSSPLTKADAVSALETATLAWLEASTRVESRLLAYLPNGELGHGDHLSDDAADAVERLGGVSLIHFAVASDLAKLAPIDVLGDDDPVSAAEPVPDSDRASAIQAVAGNAPDEGRVFTAITLSAQEADDADDNEPAGPPPHEFQRDVLATLVDRASEGVLSVLVGSAPSPHVVFLAIKAPLEAVLGLVPPAVTQAANAVVRSIVRLAKLVLRRVRDVMQAVMRGHSDVVRDLLDAADPQELVLGSTVRRVVSKLLHEQEIEYQIQHLREARRQEALGRREQGQPVIELPDNSDALRKLLKHNKRWVGRPVPIVARTLHPLWAVPVGPVAAAPIAACLLLAWTILVTGDQLDAPGYPDFWRPGLMNLL